MQWLEQRGFREGDGEIAHKKRGGKHSRLLERY
jgi:hypothetical protein